MTTFGSSDVTVTVNKRQYLAGGSGQWMSAGLISFGDGSLTYAIGGVPMPAAGTFGFKRGFDFVLVDGPEYQVGVTDAPVQGYRPNFLMKTNKLQLLATPVIATTAPAAMLTEMAASVAPTLASYRYIAFGS